MSDLNSFKLEVQNGKTHRRLVTHSDEFQKQKTGETSSCISGGFIPCEVLVVLLSQEICGFNITMKIPLLAPPD